MVRSTDRRRGKLDPVLAHPADCFLLYSYSMLLSAAQCVFIFLDVPYCILFTVAQCAGRSHDEHFSWRRCYRMVTFVICAGLSWTVWIVAQHTVSRVLLRLSVMRQSIFESPFVQDCLQSFCVYCLQPYCSFICFLLLLHLLYIRYCSVFYCVTCLHS